MKIIKLTIDMIDMTDTTGTEVYVPIDKIDFIMDYKDYRKIIINGYSIYVKEDIESILEEMNK